MLQRAQAGGHKLAGDTQILLNRWRDGDLSARDRLFAIFYPELRRAAAGMLRREVGTSLSSGDLLQECMLRLVKLDRILWQNRAQFLALASCMMRRALVDHFRARRRLKREHQRVELHTGIPDDPCLEIELINHALEQLAVIDPSRAEIVEMRYFGGMELSDIATVLNVSESTVKRRWQTAKLWLADALTSDAA